MQVDLDLARKGQLYFYTLFAIFLFFEVNFVFSVATHGNEDIRGAIFKTIFFLPLFYITQRGYFWAKWVLSILCELYGLLVLAAGYENAELLLKIQSIFLFYLSLIIHFSKSIQAFFLSRQTQSTERITQLSADFQDYPVETPIQYPVLLRRIQSSFIDGLIVLAGMVLVANVAEFAGENEMFIKMMGLFMILSYEPIMICHSSTIGQRMIGIRVKNHDLKQKNISILHAYVRFVVKITCGWLSYVTINFSPERRALHDVAANSVMIDIKSASLESIKNRC